MRILASLLLLAALAPAAHAADGGASCTVTEIVASNDGKGVDPRVDRFKRKLSRPPFTSWNTFGLIKEQVVTPELHRPMSTKLANGNMNLVYKDMLTERGGKARLRFGLDVDGNDGKRTVSTVVVFDSGDSVLIAGSTYPGPPTAGTYILALSCSAP